MRVADADEDEEDADDVDDEVPLQADDFDLVVGALGMDPRVPPANFEAGAATNTHADAMNASERADHGEGTVADMDNAAVEALLRKAKELVGLGTLETYKGTAICDMCGSRCLWYNLQRVAFG